MIDNTSSRAIDALETPEDLSTSISSISSTTPLTSGGNYSFIDTSATSWTSSTWNFPNYYNSTALQLPKYYSMEELLSTTKSILDSYEFEFTYDSDDSVVNNSSLSEKETSSDILGWVAVGFLENKKIYPYNFRLLLKYATNYTLDPTSITLVVKEGSYFENFSIKILLENNLVLIDSTSGIVHIIQEMLLENLQKAFDEIMENLTSPVQGITSSLSYCNGIGGVVYNDAISTQIVLGRQGTTSLGYCNGNSVVSYDADTTTSVNNYGVINC